MATSEQMISGAYGSIPVKTGVNTGNFYAFEAWEDTEIEAALDHEGNPVMNGAWDGETVPEGAVIFFGAYGCASLTLISGSGQGFLNDKI